MDHTSFDYKLSRAYSYAGRDSTKAIKILDELLNAEEVGTPNYAMITHSYAMLSRYLKREDDAKKYLMMSAIADIQNATRETASLQALALIQYEENNLADAFKFTQSAIDDVVPPAFISGQWKSINSILSLIRLIRRKKLGLNRI